MAMHLCRHWLCSIWAVSEILEKILGSTFYKDVKEENIQRVERAQKEKEGVKVKGWVWGEDKNADSSDVKELWWEGSRQN